ALPADDVAARLGQVAVRWQHLSRGDDLRPLVPAVPEGRFGEPLELEWPMSGAPTLRTLALLDLESHPPSAAIDRVTVAVDPTPGRVVQYSLITRPLPSPE